MTIVGIGTSEMLPFENLLVLIKKDSGAQPLVNEDGSLALAVNGEIYNHKALRKQLKHPYEFKTDSDCEVIIPLVWSSQELTQMQAKHS